ncbi:histone-like nucleoid-structuring protein Lsr2 [Streptomyces drozdowiczii]
MKKTIVTLIDDLDPTGQTPASETVPFALDGVDYEIDLSEENAHVLRARLKEFRQAGRVVKGTPARGRQPMVTPADAGGAKLNRHQGGVDPKAARAWAVEQSLSLPPRGRLPKAVKDAYRMFTTFGDRTALDKLLKEQGGRLDAPIPHQDEEDPGAPEFAVPQSVVREAVKQAEQRAASAPRRPLAAPRAVSTEELPAEQVEGAVGDAASAEEAAQAHYEPITKHDKLSGDLAKSKTWQNRMAGESKVEKMTLVERIEALTDFNVRIMRDLVNDTRNQKGGISGLSVSAARLQNLEMIEHAPGTKDGWRLTKFGRYAYEVRSSQSV